MWAFALDAPVDQRRDLAAWLTPEEHSRVQRLYGEQRRGRAIVARGRLRELLGRCLSVDPGNLRFRAGPHGKPALDGGAGLEFNLSHGGGLGLVAVSRCGSVGVDVEPLRTSLELEGLAARCLTPAERRQLAGLDQAETAAAFLRMWTRKEAFVKARGVGLTVEFGCIDVTRAAAGGAVCLDGAEVSSSCWDLRPAVGYVAAVTVLRPAVPRPAVLPWCAWWPTASVDAAATVIAAQ